MKQSLVFLGGFLLILVAGVVYGLVFQDPGVTTIRLTPGDMAQPATAQPVKHRIWKQVAFSDSLRFGQKRQTLIWPLLVQYDQQNNVYVADYGDMKIKKFTQEGDLVTTYGYKRGTDPGDILNMTDYVIRENGDLWVCDPPNGRITIFDEAGRLKHVLRLDKEPYRIRIVDDSTLIVRDSYPDSSGLFSVYRTDGRTLHRFGKLLYNQTDNMLYLDGVMSADSTVIIYALTYAGILAAYTPQGAPQFVVKTIDEVGFPLLIQNANGRRWIDRQAPVATLSIMKLEDKLYAFKTLSQQGQPRQVLDVYDIQNGRYLYSLDVSEAARDAVFMTASDEYMYAAHQDSTVVRWRWQEQPAPLD